MKKFHKALKKFLKEVERKHPNFKKGELSKINVKHFCPEHFLTGCNQKFDYFLGKEHKNFTNVDVFNNAELQLNVIFYKEDCSSSYYDMVWKYLHSMYVYAFYDTHTKSEVELFLQRYGKCTTYPSYITVEWKRVASIYNSVYGVNDKKMSSISNSPNVPGNMIHSIASEIASDLQNDDSFKNLMQAKKGGGSPEDLLASLVSGNNSDLLQKMFSTVSGKINEKIETGNLDQGAIMNEATSMLASMDSNPMMSTMIQSILKGQK
tara:strand:- start:220 stop:1011 length:792 start_codon:yes stop_codon:yes gene_type:complete